MRYLLAVLFTAVVAGQLDAQIIYQVAPGGVVDINPISSILPAGTTRMDVGLTSVPGTVHGSLYRFANFTYEPWGQGFPNPFTVFNSLGTGNENRIFAGQGFHYEASASATIGSTETIPVTYTDGFSSTSSTIQITIANVYYPVITQQPIQNPQTNPGMNAQLQVAASIPTPPTTGTLSYQWYQGIAPNASSPVSGATSPTFNWTAPAGLGQYFFWCRVTLAGQGFTASQTGTITVTNQTASVQSLVCGTNPTNAATVQYQLDFNAAGPAVGGLTASNFNLTIGGSLTGANITSVVSGLGGTAVYPTWFITVSTGSGDGTIRLNLTNATGATIGISGLPYNSGTTVTIDKTRPVVASITRTGSDPTGAAQVGFLVSFSESVTGVSAANFTLATSGLSGTSVAAVTGTGGSRTVTVNTGTGSGTLRLDVTASLSSIVDGAGNQMNVAYNTGQSYSIDKSLPTVSSITLGGANPTAAASVSFTVTFSESVTGVAAGNFSLNTSGVSGASLGTITGSGTTRTVNVSTGTGSGTIRLDLSSTSPAITDGAGNSLTATFNGGSTYTIDKTAPTISISSPSVSITSSSTVTYTVTYADANFGSATLVAADVTLNATGTATGSIGVSGSGTTRTVSIAGIAGDGTLGISIAAGTASDLAGNTAPAAGPSATFTVDNTAPAVSLGAPSASITAGGPVTYNVTYTDANLSAITLATADITLNATGTATGTLGVSGTGSTRTVTISAISGDGSLGISIAAGTAIDTAGNPAPAAGPGTTFVVDGTAPAIAISAPSVASTFTGPVTYTVTYTDANFSLATLAAGDITLNATGSATGTVSVSGTGTTRTVTISGITGDGTLGISIAAGTASDTAGNTAPAAGPSATFVVSGAPGIQIGAPSGTLTGAGPIDFTITYTNATTVTLANGDVTLTPTGTVAGTVNVTGTGTATRTVTVSAISGSGNFTISLAANTASNPGGNAAAAGPSAAVDVDNTAPGVTAGTALTISQGGTAAAATLATVTDNFSASGNVALAATTLPTGISVTAITNAAGTVTGNVAVAATVTPGAYQIGLTATDEAGNIATTNLAVTVLANSAPTITAILDQSIAMNTDTGALAFTVDDVDEGPSALAVTFTSNNQILIDLLTDIVLGGSGASRTVTVTPQASNTGVAMITLTVTDSVGATSSISFTLTVTDTTDAPALAGLVDLTIVRDQTSGPFVFTATDPQGDGTLGAPAAVSLNTALIPDVNVVFTGTAPNFSFTITPTTAMTGVADITIFISDGTQTTSRVIRVTVIDPVASSGGGDKDDDSKCSTGQGGMTWVMLLALLGVLAVAVRTRRTA